MAVKERKEVASEMDRILSLDEAGLLAFQQRLTDAVKSKHEAERVAKYDRVVKGLTQIMGEYLSEYPDLKGSKLVITTNGEVKVEFASSRTRTRQGGPRDGDLFKGNDLVGHYRNKIDACKAVGIGLDKPYFAGKYLDEKGYRWEGHK